MNIRKILIIVSTAILLILFIFTSIISYNTGKNYGVKNAEEIRITNAKLTEIHKKKPKSVFVKRVKNTNIKNSFNSSGRVVSLNNITITSEVQGILVGKNTFKKGTELKKGMVIFSVKNTDLQLLINAKKSRFLSLISSNLADIKLDFYEEYNKWETFFNTIDLNSKLPELPKMNTTKEKNYIISRSILAEYLAIKSDEEKLSKYTVLAPFDGVITKSYSDVGASVNPGSPVVDFIRKGKMEIELTVNTSEINFINIGDPVIFYDNEKEYTGNITRKGTFVNTNTQNISVFSSITANKNRLYNGMYLEASILTKESKNAFRLPRRAILKDDKVFIVDKKNKLRIKKVNIITYQGDEAIIDNIDNNILVVIEPLINIKAGTIIKPIIK
tara:strand:+ start:22 stop:1182 length:1161 start_codon:yes stop_codon:yes gene_type:complete